MTKGKIFLLLLVESTPNKPDKTMKNKKVVPYITATGKSGYRVEEVKPIPKPAKQWKPFWRLWK